MEAEIDDPDKLDLLRGEMGMTPPTRKTVSRLNKQQTKSRIKIRKGLGRDYDLFVDSAVPIAPLPRTIRSVLLNSAQHHTLHLLFIESVKDKLKNYPGLAEMKPKDFFRRQDLEDIISDSREDAVNELFFTELEVRP